MKKALMERILGAELTHHLGYAPGEAKPAAQPNHRNGSTPKTVVTEDAALPLAIPRDRVGTFAPQLVPKGVRRLPRFDQDAEEPLQAVQRPPGFPGEQVRWRHPSQQATTAGAQSALPSPRAAMIRGWRRIRLVGLSRQRRHLPRETQLFVARVGSRLVAGVPAEVTATAARRGPALPVGRCGMHSS